MKMSQVFRKAAKNAEKQFNIFYCCHVIMDVSENTKPVIYFRNLFKPETPENDYVFWKCPYESNEDQEARQLALLFAAEIAEDQGL